MKLPDYIVKLIRDGKLDNHILLSEGGSGKSCGMLESCRRILKDNMTYGEKKLIPVFIMANQLYLDDSDVMKSHSEGVYYNTVRSYLLYLCGKDVFYSAENYSRLDKGLLDMPDSSYHFLIFVDGLNECRNAAMLTEEIEQLAKFRNVSLIVSSRTKSSVLMDIGFSAVKLLPIGKEVIDELAPEANELIRKLLSRPFYLSKYAELKQRGAIAGECPTDAYDLIDRYLKWSIEKRRKKPDDGEFESAFLRFISYICFEMTRISVFYITEEVWRSAYRSFSENNFFAASEKDNETEFRRNVLDLATSIGLFVKNKSAYSQQTNGYRISHEIFRDFFVAKYIRNCIDFCTSPKDPLFKCSGDALNMLANACGIHEFLDKSGNLCVSSDRFLGILGYSEGADDFRMESFTSIFLYMTYNLLESFSNGTKEKRIFCENYSSITIKVYERVKFLWTGGRFKAKDTALELVRIHSEILRRVDDYDRSIKASNFLIEMCDEHEGSYKLVARNNIVKCGLYEAFNRAKQHTDVDRELLNVYSDKINSLRELGEAGYSSASNLYAMLLATPDPVTGRYISALYADEPIEKRRLLACVINWNMFKRKYQEEFSNYSSYFYPLQQVLSALVNEEVTWHTDNPPDSMSFDGAVADETAVFELYSDSPSHRKYSKLLSKYILEHLFSKGKTPSLRLLMVKYLIAFEPENITGISSTLNGISDIPLARFISSVIKKDNDCSELTKVMNALKKKAQARAVDAFDAIYIQQDISKTWEKLCDLYGDGFSEEYIASVNELLSMNLR